LIVRTAAEGPGTLIIDNPSFGGGYTHAWWTPAKIMEIAPAISPTHEQYKEAVGEMRCLDWDRWHWDNYVSPENGSAYLLRVWNGASVENRLKRRFPDMDVVYTWTGLIHFEEISGSPRESDRMEA
jgi:hypothetical protein